MEIYIEQGESKKDCELKIASKYNRQFQILSQKDIRLGGFLGLFSKPGVQVEFIFQQRPSNSMTTGNPYITDRMPANNFYPYARLPSPHEAPPQNSDAAFQKHLLDEEKMKILAAANGARVSHNNAAGAAAAGGAEASQKILDALKELTEKVELSAENAAGKKEEHRSFVRARDILKQNDFSDKYINSMIEKIRKELTFEQLENWDTVQDRLLELIGESIKIFKEEPGETPSGSYVMRKPRIMVLVGPTGVGKTTTISKLAAIYGIGINDAAAIDVKMITIDAFRIGAKDQIEQIGNIMQIPVSCVVNKHDLRKEIALLSEGTDLFLIDTIGKSPKDASKLGEMKDILDGAGKNAEFHLVISAGTKSSDIEIIMRQFEPFNYKSVILSKMDETDRIGNLISALAEKQKCVSYITDGQTVPVDIKKASVVRFLINLDGFKIDRDKIENRFPSGDADQFKWR